MKRPPPLIVIGLDAFDAGLARQWAAAGELPTLRRLLERSAHCEIRNAFGLFVSTVWLDFATGVWPDRHGFHCWDWIEVESYERRIGGPRWEGLEPFWAALSDAGRRIAIIDVPHARVTRPLNGVAVFEWGCHDRHFGLHSWPPEKAGELVKTYGFHPALGVEAYAARNFASDDYVHRAGGVRTPAEEQRLVAELEQGISAKRGLLSAVLLEERWDLFVGVFGESHAAGHQLWHHHDGGFVLGADASPRKDAPDSLLAVYRAIDRALGELLADAPADATLAVLISHGMGPHYDGTHLLDEVLTRLDRSYSGMPGAGWRDQGLRAIRPLVPWIRRLGHLVAPPSLRRRVGDALTFREIAPPEKRARQRFFMAPNNFVYSGIRLNLAGREPRGCVQPEQVDELCERLRRDLLELINVETGQPAVCAVERSDRHHRRSASDTIPDLFVEWERTAAIEKVRSSKIGTVHLPYLGWRSGDHRTEGMLLLSGAGVTQVGPLPPIAMEDLAPSLCARLGVTLVNTDGNVVPWLAGTGEERPQCAGPFSVPA